MKLLIGLLIGICVSSIAYEGRPDGSKTFTAEEVAIIENTIGNMTTNLETAVSIIESLRKKLSDVEKAKCI